MIREAMDFDLPQLVGMARRLHEEARYEEQGLPFDPVSMDRTFWSLMRAANGIVLVAGRGLNEHRGFAAGVMYPLYFNARQLVGQELNLWADPEHRDGTGRELVKALEGAFLQAGVTVPMMSTAESCRPGALGKAYERMGYRPFEHLYMKVVG